MCVFFFSPYFSNWYEVPSIYIKKKKYAHWKMWNNFWVTRQTFLAQYVGLLWNLELDILKTINWSCPPPLSTCTHTYTVISELCKQNLQHCNHIRIVGNCAKRYVIINFPAKTSKFVPAAFLSDVFIKIHRDCRIFSLQSVSINSH